MAAGGDVRGGHLEENVRIPPKVHSWMSFIHAVPAYIIMMPELQAVRSMSIAFVR